MPEVNRGRATRRTNERVKVPEKVYSSPSSQYRVLNHVGVFSREAVIAHGLFSCNRPLRNLQNVACKEKSNMKIKNDSHQVGGTG
jgi:hypothetical protein